MDNASTSLTPEPVLDAVLSYYRSYNANIGRGVHRLALVATQKYKDAHTKVAEFIGASPEEIIFTRNTTEAINIVANGIRWKKGDKIVVSLFEHHSNLLPWIRIKNKFGVDLEVVKPQSSKWTLEIADFEELIDENTKLVAVTHISNVLGSITPVEGIARICKDKNALFLVDGSQSVPHIPIDIKRIGCDFLAFSGHKMLAPTGTGVLFMKEELISEIEPLIVGGGAVEDASFEDYVISKTYEGFECGTPNIAGGIGLGAAVEYLEGIGMEKIKSYEEELTKKLLEGLQEIERVEIYGALDTKRRIGTVSFNIQGLHPHEVALRLDEEANIMVRSGHHCCIPLIKHLGLNAIGGTVRASLYLYNTEEEVEKLLDTLREISKSL